MAFHEDEEARCVRDEKPESSVWIQDKHARGENDR